MPPSTQPDPFLSMAIEMLGEPEGDPFLAEATAQLAALKTQNVAGMPGRVPDAAGGYIEQPDSPGAQYTGWTIDPVTGRRVARGTEEYDSALNFMAKRRATIAAAMGPMRQQPQTPGQAVGLLVDAVREPGTMRRIAAGAWDSTMGQAQAGTLRGYAAMTDAVNPGTTGALAARDAAAAIDEDMRGTQGTAGGQVGAMLGPGVVAAAGMVASRGRAGGFAARAGTAAPIGLLAAGSANQGMAEYRRTVESDGGTPGPVQELVTGIGYAGAEVLFERLGINATGELLGRAANEISGAILRRDVQAISRYAVATAKAVGVNASEEGATAFAQNLIDRAYDPEQRLDEGVTEAAVAGGMQGALLGGGSAVVGAARAGTEAYLKSRLLNEAKVQLGRSRSQRRERRGVNIAGIVDPPQQTQQTQQDAPPIQREEVQQEEVQKETGEERRRRASASDWQPRPAMVGPSAQGRAGRLRLADGTERQVRYDVVEAEDLITTHQPLNGYRPDPAGDANERAYEDPTEGQASRETVKRIANSLDPDLLLTNTPTAVDGPPITTPDYRVLGGNARSMALKIIYNRKGESSQRYRAALEAQAAAFGIDPETLKGMRAPVLVRRVDGTDPVDTGNRGELSRVLNESLTTGKTSDTDAVSRGLLLEQDHTDRIAAVLGEDTLRDVLGDARRATQVVQVMVDAGAFSPSDLIQLRKPDGSLEESGKVAIERALLGAAVGDVRTLAQTAPSIRQKLVRALPFITRLRRGKVASGEQGFDFTSTLGRSLDVLADMRESGARSIEDLVGQSSMVPQAWREDPRAIALARALLEDNQTVLAHKLRDVASVAETVAGGQEGFAFGQPRSSVDAFDEVFPTNAAATSEDSPPSSAMPDAAGQDGLYGQGRVDGMTGRQRSMWGEMPTAPVEVVVRKEDPTNPDSSWVIVDETSGRKLSPGKWKPGEWREAKAEARRVKEGLKKVDRMSTEDPRARRPGESDIDYRIRLRFQKAAENTGNLFGDVSSAMPTGQTGGQGGGKKKARAARQTPQAVIPPGRKYGTGTKPPTEDTVAQRPEDRPKNVVKDVKRIRDARRAFQDSSRVSSLDGVKMALRPILDELASALNLRPPGIGRNAKLRRWALGLYTFFRQNVRQRSPSDIGTFAHEVGHYLHELLFPGVWETWQTTRNAKNFHLLFPSAWHPDLRKLGKALYGTRAPATDYIDEGWAEVVRYLVTDPDALKKQAPTVYKEAVGMLVREYPEVWNALTRARLRLLVLKDTKRPLARYMFDSANAAGTRWRDSLTDLLVSWLDRTHRAVDFTTDLSLKDLPTHLNPHVAALRMGGHIGGDYKLIVEHGPWDLSDASAVTRAYPQTVNEDGELVDVPDADPIPSLRAILEPVREKIDLFREYMIAKRVVEKRGQGFSGAGGQLTEEELGQVIEQGEQEPAIVQAAQQFQQLNEWLVRSYAVHHGLITAESAEQIIAKNLHYITFRYTEAFEDGGRKNRDSGRGGKMGNQGRPFQYFRSGSEYEFLDPVGATLSNIYGVVSKARANQAAAMLTRHVDRHTHGVSRWLDKVEQPQRANKVLPSQMVQAVRRQMEAVLRWMNENVGEEAETEIRTAIDNLGGMTAFSPEWAVHDPSKRIIMVLREGKRQYYEVKDRRLWEMMMNSTIGFEKSMLPMLITRSTELLRTAATARNPLWFIPNFLKDLVSSLVMSEANLSKLPRNTRARLNGVKAAFLGGDMERMYLASGADMSTWRGEYYDTATLELDEKRLFRGSSLRTKFAAGRAGQAAWDTAKDLVMLEPFARLNERIELVNRYAEFERVRAGRTSAEGIAEAGQAAADVTIDFTRGGLMSKKVSQAVPFFNAAIQGTAKLGRFIRKNPLLAAQRISTFIILPTLLQLFLNRDNDDYWAKPSQMRDRYWFFPTGRDEHGGMMYLRLPKPPGLAIFAGMTERSWGSVWGIDPVTGKRGDPKAWDDAAYSFAEQILPSIGVAAVRPLVELAANHDFFRDREIVNQWEQGLPPGEQGADRSSEFARIVGRIADIPPAYTDHVVRGYLAGLGDAGLRLSDPLLRSSVPDDMRPPSPPKRFDDYLFIKSFLAGSTRTEHEALRRFYIDFDEVSAIKRKLGQLSVDPKRAEKYADAHTVALERYKLLVKAKDAMEKLGKARRQLIANPPEDPAELDKGLRQNLADMVQLARDSYLALPEKQEAE